MEEEREKVVVDKTEINNHKRTGLSTGVIILIVIVVLLVLFLLFGGNMFSGGSGVAGEPAVNTIPIPNPGQ